MKRNRGINGGFLLIVEMILSGFLFLFILVLNLAMGALGYLMEKDDYNADADLQKINKNPKNFQISIVLALIEHGSVIAYLNLKSFVLKMVRAKLLNEFFSAPLETEYFLAMLRNPQ